MTRKRFSQFESLIEGDEMGEGDSRVLWNILDLFARVLDYQQYRHYIRFDIKKFLRIRKNKLMWFQSFKVLSQVNL